MLLFIILGEAYETNKTYCISGDTPNIFDINEQSYQILSEKLCFVH